MDEGFKEAGEEASTKGDEKKKNGEEEEETLQPPTTRGSLMASWPNGTSVTALSSRG